MQLLGLFITWFLFFLRQQEDAQEAFNAAGGVSGMDPLAAALGMGMAAPQAAVAGVNNGGIMTEDADTHDGDDE
jgi:hypothetical protein